MWSFWPIQFFCLIEYGGGIFEKRCGLEGIKHPRICFRHFKKKDFLQTGKLKANALPSQNLPPKIVKIQTKPQYFIKKEPLETQPITEQPMEIQPLEIKEEPSESEFAILGI